MQNRAADRPASANHAAFSKPSFRDVGFQAISFSAPRSAPD
jgi:hypothetical protein